MNRQMASVLGIAAAAAAAAVAMIAGDARAEGDTIDTRPFISQKGRAEVRAELLKYPQAARETYGEAGWQNSLPSPFKSSVTRAEARADYIAAREEVRLLTSEAGLPAQFKYTPQPGGTSIMGAPAR